MDILAGVICGLFALVISPILRWVEQRTPYHQSVTRPPHHCRNCGTHSVGKQSISLLAIVGGRRSCGVCSVGLWPRVPVFEVFMAVALGVVGYTIGLIWTLPAYFVFFVALILISAIDLRNYMIPNRVLYPALYLTLLLLGVVAVAQGRWDDFGRALLGMAGSWLFFFIVWFIYPRGMGFGDVRLAALVGLVCGWVSVGNVFLAILLSFFIGAATGVVLIILKFRNRKQAIPFGPFLASGAAISVLWGATLWG